ncbi:Sucrase/ferredoxin-like-domain-containing protein [Panaeolus papilionaceus]|nr:Sucrase/ferredoxin-like-domain-containing protein [Panaeolus papilionaceus]
MFYYWNSGIWLNLQEVDSQDLRMTYSIRYYVGPLDGTASEHDCYILLHTNQPPGQFPMKKTTRISNELQARAIQWKGLVNFAWRKSFATCNITDDAPSATVFSTRGGRLELPRVSLDNMNEVQQTISAHLQGPVTKETAEEAHVYVCTHGERDCRCGSMGRLVVDALEKELEKRLAQDPAGPFSHIKIGEVGHIGGHKHAANLLIFPHGEWLGQLRPEDAPQLLERIGNITISPATPQQLPDWGNHWRGRMGLQKQEQKDLWKAYLERQNPS